MLKVDQVAGKVKSFNTLPERLFKLRYMRLKVKNGQNDCSDNFNVDYWFSYKYLLRSSPTVRYF